MIVYTRIIRRELAISLLKHIPMRRVGNPDLGQSQNKPTTWITIPFKLLILLYKIDMFIFLETQPEYFHQCCLFSCCRLKFVLWII